MSARATGQSGGFHTVFISYNEADLETATRLAKRLRGAGLQVMIQDESMLPGERISAFIERAITASDAVLSLVSERSLLSAWVGEESVATLNRTDRPRRFIGCYLDKTFLEDSFTLKATSRIDADIRKIEGQYGEYFAAKLDTQSLNAHRSRLNNLRFNLPRIVAGFGESHMMDLRDETFDTSVERILDSFRAPGPDAAPTPPSVVTPAASDDDAEPPKSWLRRNVVGVGIVAFLIGVFGWAYLESIRTDRIEASVGAASRAFLRHLAQQDAGAVAASVTVPFFFGDDELQDSQAVRDFFDKLFGYAKSDAAVSDSVVVRRAAALSRYFAGEMQRQDRDVFETVDISIRSDLDREEEKSKKGIPEPRMLLTDGVRATIRMVGFKEVKVLYLYFSEGEAAKFRGALLVGG